MAIKVQVDDSDKITLQEASLALRGEQLLVERLKAGSAAQALPAFLSRVLSDVPFYRRLPANGAPDLARFPSTCRADLYRRPGDFAFPSATGPIIAKTSGTSHQPLSVLFDEASWYDQNINAYGYLRPLLKSLGVQLRTGSLGVAGVVSKASREAVSLWLPSCEMSLYERFIIGASRDQDLDVVERLRRTRIPVLHGKPHVLRALADIDETLGGSDRIRAQIVVASGETLHSDDRARFHGWYKCPVVDAYVSTEGGLLAIRGPRATSARVQNDRIVLEVRRNDGRIYGTGYGELVLTNPSNWGTAFVRYLTNDWGRLSDDGRGQTFLELEGRELLELVIGHRRIPTALLSELFSTVNIWDFTVRVEGSTVFASWVPTHSSPDDRVTRTKLESFFQSASGVQLSAGPTAVITPRGGKRIRYPRA